MGTIDAGAVEGFGAWREKKKQQELILGTPSEQTTEPKSNMLLDTVKNVLAPAFGPLGYLASDQGQPIWQGLKAGTGKAISSVTDTFQALGKPSYMSQEEWDNSQTSAIKAVEGFAKGVTERNQQSYIPYSPKWFKYNVGEMIPTAGALAATTAVALKSTNQQAIGQGAAQAARLLGASPKFVQLAEELAPAAVVSVGGSIPEAALEGQGAYEEAIKEGRTPEEAEQIRSAVQNANTALLTGSNIAEIALGFSKLPFKIPQTTLAKLAVNAARVAGTSAIQGVQEGAQQIIPKQVKGEEWSVSDPDVQQAAVLGAGAGALFGVAGRLITSPVDQIIDLKLGKTKIPEQQTSTVADDFGQWKETKTAKNTVYEDVKANFIASGSSEAEANAYAQIYANHSEVFGKEYGVNADEYYQTKNFKVAKENIDEWVSGATNGVNNVMLSRLAQLAADKGEIIEIADGFRTYDEQAALFANSDGNGTMVAAPGRSRHEVGYAIDVGSQWVKDLSNEELAEYGLHKPMDYENWHIEPIETSGKSTDELRNFELSEEDQVFEETIDEKPIEETTGIYEKEFNNTVKDIEEKTNNKNYAYGLRVIPSDVETQINIGDTLPNSFKWINNNITDKQLEGTSVIRIGRGMPPERALEHLGILKTGDEPIEIIPKKYLNGYYRGDQVVLVRGERGKYGKDAGELLIKKPEVIGVYKKRGTGREPFKPQKTLTEIDQELSEKVNEEIEPVTPAIGGSLKFTKKSATDTEIPVIKFDNAETEARWQEASKGLQKETLLNRAKEGYNDLKNKATRVYEDLPNGAEFAQLKFDLLELEKQKSVAGEITNRLMQGIVIPLDKAGLDLFTRKVILDDLAQTEGELPFGLTKETLAIEKAKTDQAIKNSPKVAQAVETRRQVWDAAKAEYVQAMKAIGFNVADKVSRQDYFRHQVLEYANLRAVSGTGTRLKSPTKRGFLKTREGSTKDINANYLQAEFEVMAQMMYDIELAKTIKEVEKNYSIREELVKKYGKEWRNHIPEGYVTWQPREGSSFYMANTIPEKLATQVLEGVLEEVGVSADQIGKVLAKGSPFKEFVVKEEVAKTLNKVSEPPSESAVGKLSRSLVTPWKVWTLMSPTRVIKYNLRNITGDADALFTMNPTAFKQVPKAITELYQTVYGNRAMTPEMKEWFKRGGMETTSPVQELPDVNKLRMFEKFADKDPNFIKNAWVKYWTTAKTATQFRESIFRYATYLDYLKQMEENNGTPRNFGASMPDEVMALDDIRDRAFKLSNDVLGAYDNVSVLGKDIRNHVWAFWSFAETNFSRYKQFFKNQTVDKQLAEAVGRKIVGTLAIRSPYYLYRVGVFTIKAGAVWAMLQAYNHLVWGDEEKELPIDEQSRPHIILGRDEKGNVRYFSRLGSFSDFLEWFGTDSVVKDVKDYLNGDRNITEIALDALKSPVNKLVQGVSPTIKTPAELLTGKRLFPDAFNPRTIKDSGQYIADSFGLGNEFRAISRTSLAQDAGINPRPGKPYLNTDTGENLLYYKAEPNRASYYNILDKKRKFLKDTEGIRGGDYDSDKTNALRNYKLAIKEKDANTAAFYLAEYKRLGGTKKGLQRSLEAMDPLAGLNDKKEKAFKAALNGEEKQELENAIKYYKTVLMGK